MIMNRLKKRIFGLHNGLFAAVLFIDRSVWGADEGSGYAVFAVIRTQ